MKYVYSRLKDLREDQDRTQAEVAELLNTYTTQYRRWESGETEVPTHIVKQLCIHYNVSADYILGFTNQKTPLPQR